MKTAIIFVMVFLGVFGVVYGQDSASVPSKAEAPPETSGSQQTQANAQQYQGTPLAPIPVFIINAPDATGQRPASDAQASPDKGQDSLERWNKISAIAVSFFTFGLFAVAVFQFIWMFKTVNVMKSTEFVIRDQAAAMQKTIAVMEDANERQLRAYVSIDILDVEYQRDGGLAYDRPFIFNTLITNTGKTPASDVEVQVEIIYISGNIPTDFAFAFKDPPMSKRVLFPDQVDKIPVGAERQYTPDELHLLVTNKSKLYVYGLVKYVDVFGGKPETRFCNYLFRRPNGTWTTLAAGCGNSAT